MTVKLDDEQAIFEVARKIDLQGARETYLLQACGQDQALRQRVTDLLRAYEESGSFLESSPPGLNVASGAGDLPTFDQPITEKSGTIIGPYKLLQEIGEGGMGTVYMAEQAQPVQRKVALKIIKPGMDSRQVIARFEAERQALALMDHPNIARILDAGATAAGRPYFVMELVKGIPIIQYCDEHRLTPRQRLELFITVCQAVQHAHQKGIIHRDLKPTNILVAEYDEKPMAKIIDFGVAKAVGQQLTERTLFTEFGQVVGTIEYMSPEQAKLNQLDIDTRTDVYSLGVLLYELLSGSTPFDKDRLRSAAFDEMLRIIREEEPPKPSTRLSTSQALPSIAANRQLEPKKLMMTVSGDLDWIVMKSLEKDRARRYETATGLAEDIQRYLTDQPVEACTPTCAYRLRKFISRNKVAVFASSTMVAALAVGLIISSIGLMQARRQAIRADRETVRSQQVARFLKDMLAGVGPSVALGRDTTVLKEILDKTALRAGGDLKSQPEAVIELRITLAEVYYQLGLYEQSQLMAEQNVLLCRLQDADETAFLAKALQQQAGAVRRLRHPSRAEEVAREALAIDRKIYGNEDEETADSLVILGLSLIEQEKSTEAESIFREALAIQRKLLGNEHPKVAVTYGGLSVVLLYEGRLKEAENAAREAVEIQTKTFGTDHPELADALGTLSDVFLAEGMLSDAEALRRQALAMRRKFLGEEHPNVAFSVERLAKVLRAQGHLVEAEQDFRKALAINRKAYGNHHPDIAISLELLGRTLVDQEKFPEAESLFRESLSIRREAFGNTDPETSASLDDLIDVLKREGKSAEAKELRLEFPKPSDTTPSKSSTELMFPDNRAPIIKQ